MRQYVSYFKEESTENAGNDQNEGNEIRARENQDNDAENEVGEYEIGENCPASTVSAENEPKSKSVYNELQTTITKKLAGKLDELFWATVVICSLVNIGCTAVHLNTSLKNPDFDEKILPLKFITFTLEVVLVLYFVQGFELSATPDRRYKRVVIVVLHTAGICSILWFLRWLGSNLIVAIFFIVLAPAQTLAAIALIYSVIASTVMVITYIIYRVKRRTRSTSKLEIVEMLLVLIYYCLVVVFLNITPQ